MAFSQPLSGSVNQKEQTTMLCQLCENDPKLKWKCLDCGLMMCQRCQEKVHPKFPSADDHTIIDIQDISSKHLSDPESRPDLTRIKCGVHSGQNCCLYCKTCQELVCLTCIAKAHNKHDFGEISEEYHRKLEKVKTRENDLRIVIQNLTGRKQQLKQIQSTEKANYEKVKQDILDDEKALVNEIKEHTNKLIKELDQKYEAIPKSTLDEESKLEALESHFQKQSQQINHLLQPINAKDLFTDFDAVLQSTETNFSPINTSFYGVPRFTQGDRTKIPFIVGKLKDAFVQYNREIKVDKIFETELTNIDNVVSCPDDSLWISYFNSCILQKVKPQGDNLSVISNIKKKVFNAALLPSDDLLLSVGGSYLKQIPSGSTNIQDSVYTVSPLHSTAVHATCNNKVIVGAAGGQSLFPATGPRQVIVMDQTGHQEYVFQYDRHNKTLFSVPYRITSDRRGNIAVIDMFSVDCRGRVVILDQEGVLQNIYTGHPDVNSENHAFKPTGITTTTSDIFVIAEMDNQTLHILNSKGEIITFYNIEEMGILLPYSLSFSTSGQLYIGCLTHENSKENAKLFKVTNFLC